MRPPRKTEKNTPSSHGARRRGRLKPQTTKTDGSGRTAVREVFRPSKQLRREPPGSNHWHNQDSRFRNGCNRRLMSGCGLVALKTLRQARIPRHRLVIAVHLAVAAGECHGRLVRIEQTSLGDVDGLGKKQCAQYHARHVPKAFGSKSHKSIVPRSVLKWQTVTSEPCACHASRATILTACDALTYFDSCACHSEALPPRTRTSMEAQSHGLRCYGPSQTRIPSCEGHRRQYLRNCALRYLADVRNACLQHNCSNVLIEENLVGPSLRIAEIFEIVEERTKNSRPTVQRIAYTDVNPDHDFTSMQFAETVAANRSLNLRVFRNVREAEEWLIAEIDRAGKLERTSDS